jgi:dCMP deaminase
MKKKEKWDRRFLELAKFISTWSKDPSTKVGAVIVDKDRRVVSVGYNGFPAGIKDDYRLDDRATKLDIAIHAEINALSFANKKNFKNCTVYTYPMFPCSRCCSQLIQNKISRIVSIESETQNWRLSIELSKQLCKEKGVEFCLY